VKGRIFHVEYAEGASKLTVVAGGAGRERTGTPTEGGRRVGTEGAGHSPMRAY